jgi:hypothetical protein
MNRLIPLAAAVCGLCASPAAPALHISEPPTVFYGRVFQRGPSQEFVLTQGELTWVLRSTAHGSREYRLSTKLESLGGGRFSYRLTVPHQALAYDLSVAAKAVPLPAAGSRLEHIAVTVNGQPATIVAPAVDSLTAQQSTRAATYRVDLQIGGDFVDSDGDGVPDWWEDQNGWDKWDPSDGSKTSTLPTRPTPPVAKEQEAMTFSRWRELHFPSLNEELNAFAQHDPDEDGISNLLEYAFNLSPIAVDDLSARRALPSMSSVDGRIQLTFYKRTDASDLLYVVEVSEDLIHWRAGSDAVEAPDAGSRADGAVAFRVRSEATDPRLQFMRVRVERAP